MGDNGIFHKATDAKLQTETAKAKEKLEIVLSSAKIEKHTNKQYNENQFLNEYIQNNLKGAEIIGDIVIVDGYAFELDRSVPKIGEYVGEKENLTFPEINISEIEYSSDYKSAKFIITAKENKNGINKIEIIQYGKVLDTFEYSNEKEEIREEYTVRQNGEYKVKVYSKLSNYEMTEIKDLVLAVEYSPNGNEEYKKGHSTKITVKETTDRVKSLKYQWSEELTMPEESSFTQNCNNNDTIVGKDITGIYYLWILLETESGKKNICRSEGFYFDNEGPTVKLTSTPISETSFTLKVVASDTKSGIAKYELYDDNTKLFTNTEWNDYTWTGTEMTQKDFYVIVTDKAGNSYRNDCKARTKMHTWEKWEAISKIETKLVKEEFKDELICSFDYHYHYPPVTSTGAKQYAASFQYAKTYTVTDNKFTLEDIDYFTSTDGTLTSSYKQKLSGKYYYPQKATFCNFCKAPSLGNLEYCYYITSVTDVTKKENNCGIPTVTIRGNIKKYYYWTGEVWKPTNKISDDEYTTAVDSWKDQEMNEDGYYYVYKGIM